MAKCAPLCLLFSEGVLQPLFSNGSWDKSEEILVALLEGLNGVRLVARYCVLRLRHEDLMVLFAEFLGDAYREISIEADSAATLLSLSQQARPTSLRCRQHRPF
ncbi:hypothetical protein DFP72DRAFT_856673 [Ephemerocybe angulata]|uniref:Uncharacterized protein n=1 Tax=Ephemerocybe angulata TaxID=980116 RepID=A0A8H6HFD1_9AGAR|nr:hypothetical protein DFP72DRAFT_864450 [Tulosesus angulatus]KAF6743347.1 hypothetical protein DFP72DRAFT_859048 [Tulosesus angulatus]KAF6745286.1 hypothetical protein DFP72DRAFT_856673 [Tulosesus angulatus]